MSKSSLAVLATCFLLVWGCVSHRGWMEDKNTLIGTRFDPNSNRNQSGDIYKSVSLSKGETVYYRKDQEPPNTRYFIQWTPHCRYSLLVAPDGTILSWRVEDTKDPEQACVIH